ncbi:MAG: RNA-dependent polymerase [Firmicutes bacterium]|nr:RNA-dependent polymerase [Bacillota bacterium]
MDKRSSAADRKGNDFVEPNGDLVKSAGNGWLFDLSRELDISCRDLGWLHGTWGTWNQWYKTYTVPKKTEGFRVICAPQGLLLAVQRKINDVILKEVVLSSCCHGFVKERSIITNAAAHVQKEVLLSLDIKDFFSTITANRVFGVFKSLGRSPEEARFLTRLCTYNGCLPQGAPSSPAIANRACNHMDKRLAKLAEYHRAAYSRYADDLTFSGDKPVLRLLPLIKAIVAEEGFAIAEHKTRVAKQNQRQVVTGLTVNSEIKVRRPEKRRIRAILHHAACRRSTTSHQVPIGVQEIRGYYSFLKNVEPEYAAKLYLDLHEKYLMLDLAPETNPFWLSQRSSR